MPVTFSYADRKFNFPGKKKLKEFIGALVRNEQDREVILNYVFCSDDFLLDINKRFLKHDYYTDIITFDLTEADDVAIRGEIYISTDRIEENARSMNINFQDEILRVIFHGALHLCGFKDKKKSEIAVMRQMEDHYLRLYLQSTK